MIAAIHLAPEPIETVAPCDIGPGETYVVARGLAAEAARIPHRRDLQSTADVGDNRYVGHRKDPAIFLDERRSAHVGESGAVRLDLLRGDPDVLAGPSGLSHGQAAFRIRQALFLHEQVLLPVGDPPGTKGVDVRFDLPLELALGVQEVLLQRTRYLDALIIETPPEDLREHVIGNLGSEAARDLV